MFGEADQFTGQEFERPARPPVGWLEQAVATSSACSLPDSFRFAPGRGSSLSAAAKLLSSKRRFVRYAVEPPEHVWIVTPQLQIGRAGMW
jgi:hypothetical protein